MSAPGGRAGRRLDLEPVVRPRIVAGGDDDPGRRASLDDLVSSIWVGTAWRGESDGDVVGEEDLGGGGGEVLGGEPAVVGDHDALGLLAALDDVAGDAVGAAADVLERVVVGDLRSPAVGPEDDRRRLRRLGDVRHARASCWSTRSSRASTSGLEMAGAGEVGPDTVGNDRAPRVGRIDDEASVCRADEQIVRPDIDRLAALDDASGRAAAGRRRQARRGAPTSCRDRSSRHPSSP